MDTDLVTRAQRGDEGAFMSLAVAAGDRLHFGRDGDVYVSTRETATGH